MSEHNKKKPYSMLDKLNLEELHNLLQEDFNSSDDLDMEYITAILDVIKERENENSAPIIFNAESSWLSLEDNYLSAHPITTSEVTQISDARHIRGRRRIWQAVAAALVITLLFGAITAQAFGYNIFTMIAQWTDDVFTLSSSDDNFSLHPEQIELPPDKQFETIQEALDFFDIHAHVIPHWIPDGFYQTNINALQIPDLTMINAFFENDDRTLFISYTIYNDQSIDHTNFFVKDDNPVREYQVWGIKHYIFTNDSRFVAVWMDGYIEGSINGNITEDELIRMINSIYE